jgi:hypothetical protein
MSIREYLEYDDDSDGEGGSRSAMREAQRAAAQVTPTAVHSTRHAPPTAARPARVPLIYTLCTLLL